MNVKLLLVSSLEKVFPDEEPRAFNGEVEGLLNEIASFQVSWRALDSNFTRDYARLEIESPISEYISVRRVRYVPVLYPAPADADDNYLRKTPGLYPDPLTPVECGRLRIWGNHWESAWLDIEADDLPEGSYPIDIQLISDAGVPLAAVRVVYKRLPARLPEQKLIHTKWFHADALCDQYGVEMFSEKFWAIAENFVRAAAKRSINALLTPIHTPPLDTRIGRERRTCQLVDIEKRSDQYVFGFEKLERWVRMAQRCGVKYFEMAHLFTQWGAKCAPKIVAKVDGEVKRIFGWDTSATSPEYADFLRQYLTALTGELKRLGIAQNCIFHISDEPQAYMVDDYMKAKRSVEKLLDGYTIIDALSDIELYVSGAVTKPVPANNHIRPFLDAKIPGLWTYYCVGQYIDVSNSFVSMPSARTRIIGVQLYKYDIEGFLQWGYNFYNSQASDYSVNPYLSNDGDGFTPAGDCFQVYPGKDGQPVESIRMMVMAQAVYDMRALKLLEALKGREFVMDIVEDGIAPIEFDKYPLSPNYLFGLRSRVNAEIVKALGLQSS